MASPFPRLTTPHFFAPIKRCAFSLSGAKKRQLPKTVKCHLQSSKLLKLPPKGGYRTCRMKFFAKKGKKNWIFLVFLSIM